MLSFIMETHYNLWSSRGVRHHVLLAMQRLMARIMFDVACRVALRILSFRLENNGGFRIHLSAQICQILQLLKCCSFRGGLAGFGMGIL